MFLFSYYITGADNLAQYYKIYLLFKPSRVSKR